MAGGGRRACCRTEAAAFCFSTTAPLRSDSSISCGDDEVDNAGDRGGGGVRPTDDCLEAVLRAAT